MGSLNAEEFDVSIAVLRDKTFLEIIRAVLRENHDLVMMTADSWQGIRELAFGTDSMHLMQKCPCPVWVMQPEAGRRFKRVMAAVDLTLGENRPSPLDIKILELASSLARKEKCHLDVFHAWEFSGADRDTGRSEIDDEIRTNLFCRNRSARRAGVDQLFEHVDMADVNCEAHLPMGEPARAISRFAFERETDLIVLGTATRAGIPGFQIGRTAETVLKQVDCSVSTAKPDGFISPVTIET